MTAPEDQNGLREALARCECGAVIDPREVIEDNACDACLMKRWDAEAAAHRNPAPLPIPVRDRYDLVECEHCGWVGSSEQCGTDAGFDDSDVYCPICCNSMLCEGPSEADTAKHGQAVFDRITSAETRALAAEAEITRLKEGMEAALRPFADAIDDRERRAATIAAGGGWMSSDDIDNASVGLGHLRRARSALATLSPKEQP